jgi:hypothetical protein
MDKWIVGQRAGYSVFVVPLAGRVRQVTVTEGEYTPSGTDLKSWADRTVPHRAKQQQREQQRRRRQATSAGTVSLNFE